VWHSFALSGFENLRLNSLVLSEKLLGFQIRKPWRLCFGGNAYHPRLNCG
jgi:hypothetical protein